MIQTLPRFLRWVEEEYNLSVQELVTRYATEHSIHPDDFENLKYLMTKLLTPAKRVKGAGDKGIFL